MPGNPALLDRVIDHLLNRSARRSIDARRAEPGEFTAAPFSGKLRSPAKACLPSSPPSLDAQLRRRQLTADGLGRFAREVSTNWPPPLALVEARIDLLRSGRCRGDFAA